MHPLHTQIIAKLKTLNADPSPWLIAIHEYLPKEDMHVMLVDQLTSQAMDDCGTMSRIVGVEITELLIGRKINIS